MNPEVDIFFNKDDQWQTEYNMLRKIMLDCGLDEKLKWGKPCYVYKGKNIVVIHGFNEYCALLFIKGILLRDIHNILVQQTKNVQSARQIRLTEPGQISELEPVIKAYVYEAIEAEKAGLKVSFKKTAEYDMPEELEEAMQEDAELKQAFEDLTPGRKRGYMLYLSQAKQSATRRSRIEKVRPKILEGKGYNER
ncbi:MAG: YdeI/OmpD-associated family protein [Cyclobacteriaceae bacterium]